ncbi:MAG: sulfur carrier protein ThiS [Dehalococcoidia bacterium]|nr:sulfur carrier protein ThiS [Dehalococcoidia bacterium]
MPLLCERAFQRADAMINLTVNGKPTELQHPIPLLQFLQDRGVNTQFIAVAYNGTVLRREEFGTVTLTQGDVLEIVRPVGGG